MQLDLKELGDFWEKEMFLRVEAGACETLVNPRETWAVEQFNYMQMFCARMNVFYKLYVI